MRWTLTCIDPHDTQAAAELLFDKLIALPISHDGKRGANENRREHQNDNTAAQCLDDPRSGAGSLRVT